MSLAYRVLRMVFPTRETLDREYWANLANGGLFVPGHFELIHDEPVVVFCDLDFAGASIELEGRVVQAVPVAFEENGARSGVALALQGTPDAIRARFEEALGERLLDEREEGAGLRATPRSTAHVRARVVRADGTRVEGRTRNVSLDGALIALGGTPPEIGESLQVELLHPTTGEERALLARVARHDRDESGTVRGIGVRFEVLAADADATRDFLAAVKGSEHARRLGGISGSIETLGLDDLLSSFGQCVPRGRFTLEHGGAVGTIHLEAGRLVSARVGAVHGLKALVRMAGWQKGSFAFHAHLAPEEDGEPMDLPVQAALLEAARLVDERRHVDLDGLAPEAGLEIGLHALDVDLDELTPVDLRILDLADQGLTVGHMLDAMPEPDPLIERSLASLIERDIVRVERHAVGR